MREEERNIVSLERERDGCYPPLLLPVITYSSLSSRLAERALIEESNGLEHQRNRGRTNFFSLS